MNTGKPDEIRVGDRVRSYDFHSPLTSSDTCYVEGVVEGIEPADGLRFGMCDRYAIRIIRRVWHGRQHTAAETAQEFPTGRAYPPVNGTPCTLGGVTSGVKRLGPEAPDAGEKGGQQK